MMIAYTTDKKDTDFVVYIAQLALFKAHLRLIRMSRHPTLQLIIVTG